MSRNHKSVGDRAKTAAKRAGLSFDEEHPVSRLTENAEHEAFIRGFKAGWRQAQREAKKP